jgi:xanthosine utilization system XapX-like protein
MSEPTPEPTELVYVPEPSWMPAIAAFGLLGVLTGIFVWWPYGAIGGVIALVGLIGILRNIGPQVQRLPRRQKLTTAVLPAVPPRKPAE